MMFLFIRIKVLLRSIRVETTCINGKDTKFMNNFVNM